MRKLLVFAGLIALWTWFPSSAGAHEDPPGCTTSGSFANIDPNSGLFTIHRNGDHLEIGVRVRNDFANACTITDGVVNVRLPNPDGTPGPITNVATGLNLPGGTAQSTLPTTVPYDVNLNAGIFSAPITVSFDGTLHGPGGDGPMGAGSATQNVVISRPHVTVNVTPTATSGPAPFSTTYNYSVLNDSPPNPADLPPPALVPPGGGTAALVDDTCSPLVFTGGDTTVTSPPILQRDEAWTFTCMHMFGSPGAFTNTVGVAGTSTRDGRPWPVTTDQSTVTATGPDVAMSKSHAGDFTAGDLGRTYELTARNAGNQATSGTVTLADQLPAGLSATAISGAGWSCAIATLTCSRSDALAGGASYPPVMLTVDVAADAPGEVVNEATVEGGGEPAGAGANNSATDPTTIAPKARPSNAFSLGRAKSGRGGKVTLSVDVPGAGALEADDAGRADLLKAARGAAEGAGKVQLLLRPTKRAKRKLKRRKSIKAVVAVTFTPTGGDPAAKEKKVKLKAAKK